MKPFAVALCVIIDDYGRLLLTHRTIGEFTHWELPGGHIEEEETAEYAAVREAQEKLGVAIRLVKSLGKELSEELDQTYSFDYFQAVISLGTNHNECGQV
jgi:8-oxo-dGTP diphosphatase